MRKMNALLFGLALLAPVCAVAALPTPAQALKELKAGNTRFIDGLRERTIDTELDPDLRAKLAKGQSPIAVVVTCADSRVDETLVFDQEPGRIFTVREAGNCPDTLGKASVEYAVGHLHTPLVVVLGHNTCGAVKAVATAGSTPLPGLLKIFQTRMKGLVENNPRTPGEEDQAYFDRLSLANAKKQAQELVKASTELHELAVAGKVKVVYGVLHIGKGKVSLTELAAK